MARKKVVSSEGLLFAINVGNGTCQMMTSQARDVVQFEPVIAPITDKRGLEAEDEKPRFSLMVDDSILVAGVTDVMKHGKSNMSRRRNSIDRVTIDDYFYFLAMLFLHGFADLRGRPEVIQPTGIITVPNSVYNDAEAIGLMESRLFRKTEKLVDYDGCELRLELKKDRVFIRPEAAFDVMHWARTGDGRARAGNSMAGSLLIVDIGYLTTQFSLFVDGVYQRDQSYTLEKAGMIVVVERIHDWLSKGGRGVDMSYLDIALREVAKFPLGAKKLAQVAPGVMVDVAPVYDSAVTALAQRIIDEASTRYPKRISKGSISGGGFYHLGKLIDDKLPVKDMYPMPDPEVAGVVGTYQAVNQRFGHQV
jgi:hypothetical protein